MGLLLLDNYLQWIETVVHHCRKIPIRKTPTTNTFHAVIKASIIMIKTTLKKIEIEIS